MRVHLLWSLVGSVIAFSGAAVSAQWTAVVLHPPGARSSTANGVWGNEVGGVASINGVDRGILWSTADGSYVDLTPPHATESRIFAVRNGRQGGSVIVPRNDGGSPPAFEYGGTWRGSSESWIPVPDREGGSAFRSQVRGLSDDEIVGSIPFTPALWRDGQLTILGLNSTALAVGVDRGRQVGGTPSRALLWSGSAESVINLVPAQFTKGTAYGISGEQQVGFVGNGTNSEASLWRGSAASWVSLAPPGFTNSIAQAVHRGRQAGVTGGFPPTPFHAAVWQGTAASWQDLHPFLPAGYSRSTATGIWWGRNVIQVCGFARFDATRQDHAILWTRARCEADFNDDGVVDADDLGAYLEAFDDSESFFYDLVDYTDDGFVDFFDLIAFLDAMDRGCETP